MQHIKPRPILLLGGADLWTNLIKWIEGGPLKMGLLSQSDVDNLIVCSSIDDVIRHLEPEIKSFKAKINQGKSNT